MTLDCRASARRIGKAGVRHHAVGEDEDERLFVILVLVNAGLRLLLALPLGLINLDPGEQCGLLLSCGRCGRLRIFEVGHIVAVSIVLET